MKRALVVGVSMKIATTTVSSVTYGGTNLTQAGRQTATGPGTGGAMEIWYLVAPAVGTANVHVTISTSQDVVGGAVSFRGVSQVAPLGTFTSASGNSGTPSVTLTSATGELVLDTLYAQGDAGAASAGGPQSPLWNIETGTGNTNITGAGSTQAGAATITMSWSTSGSKPWAIGAVPVKPARRIVVQ